jgi:anthranilate synthase component 1
MTGGSKAFSAFAGIFESGAPQLISRELIADTQTPVSAYLKLAAGTPNSFCLNPLKAARCAAVFQ